MPRSRRRHHSRSRTRSRSHSFDREREPKRRKIESYDSSHKRSLSPESNEEHEEPSLPITAENVETETKSICPEQETEAKVIDVKSDANNLESQTENEDESSITKDVSNSNSAESHESETDSEVEIGETDVSMNVDPNTSQSSELETPKHSNTAASKISPKKPLTPSQLAKKLEREKLLEAKQETLKKKKQELLDQKLKVKAEKDKLRQEKREQKEKEKQEKLEQKQKELEVKQKEKELKEEKKKKEREEKELKRKEKEEKEEQKRKEMEEKNKEKQKQKEKKQKAAAAFATFFKKKTEIATEEKRQEDGNVTVSGFMPFEVKADMKLAPLSRLSLNDDEKTNLLAVLENQTDKSYLEELKCAKRIRKSQKTWPVEDSTVSDDVIIVEDVAPGESIEEMPEGNKMRAKFLKFNDNRRPAYFGTWRKKSKYVRARKPFAMDKENFDYEIDSDEDWEEDNDSGESLRGSDDDEKENDSENEYEEDDEFFVPHGYLSDDEVNDEECGVESPESHKAKLKLLKKEFEEQMMGKTQKLKPRFIGCIWFNKGEENVDPAIRDFLKPFSMISNGPVVIKKRSKLNILTPRKNTQVAKLLPSELIPDFLKFIHGSTVNKRALAADFLEQMIGRNIPVDVSKSSLRRQFVLFADWIKCPEEGAMHNKFCWYVREDAKEKYDVKLSLPVKQ